MTHPVSVKEQVVALRSAGYSYSYISGQVGLSKSTLSDWLGKIPYTPNEETIATIGKALAASGAKIAKKKQETFLIAQKEAEEEIGDVSQRDLFMFGLGLYLGEGNKSHEMVRLVNSDPRVIRFAIAWFEFFDITRKNFAVTLHLYPDSDIEKSTEFWMKHTKIPRNQFLKPQIDWRKDKKIYKIGKLPFGTAHLGVRCLGEKKFGTFFFRKILAYIDEMSKKIKMRT